MAFPNRRAGRPVEDLDVAELLAQSDSLGLLIHDRDDREIPFSDAEAIAQRWPAARLVATEGFGHRAILRQAAVWEVVADFVAGGACSADSDAA